MLKRFSIGGFVFTDDSEVSIGDKTPVATDGKAEQATADARAIWSDMGDIYVHKAAVGKVDAVRLQMEGTPEDNWWVTLQDAEVIHG